MLPSLLTCFPACYSLNGCSDSSVNCRKPYVIAEAKEKLVNMSCTGHTVGAVPVLYLCQARLSALFLLLNNIESQET